MAVSPSIKDLLLFISTSSANSRTIVQYIQTTQVPLPISIIKLDTEEARERAGSGKYFSIKSVPTLAVVLSTGNIQLFVGSPKIVEWLISAYNPPTPPSPPRPSRDGTDYSILEGVSGRIAKVAPGPVLGQGNIYEDSKSRRRIIVADDIDDVEDRVYGGPTRRGPVYEDSLEDSIEEEIEEEEEILPLPKSKTKLKKTKAKSKTITAAGKSKTRRRRIEEESLEEDPRLIAKAKLSAARSSKTGSSRMDSIKAAAKQMEEQMYSTRGYKEEDLPHF
jgi:hypothetical protein